MAARATSPSRLQPEARRAQLLDAAIRTFIGRDPSTVGVDEIAAGVGVSRSLVYAYFGDRAGLISAVHAALVERVDQAVGLTDADIETLAARRQQDALHDVVRRYFEFARDHAGEWQLLGTIGAMSLDAICTSRDRHTERVGRIWGGGPAGRLVARSVIGMVEAGTRQWRAHPDLDLERAATIVTAVGWQGLAELPRFLWTLQSGIRTERSTDPGR